MVENKRIDDAEFAHEILKVLPTTAVPAALEARLLSDFDRLAGRRRLPIRLAQLGERLWPGAPIWQPASVLALSLIIGLTAGAILPAAGIATTSSEQVLLAADTAPDLDLDRD